MNKQLNMEKTQLEKQELSVLNDSGYTFEIEYHKITKPLFFFEMPKMELVKKSFNIKPLRLSTLDRIAKYQLELYLDDEVFKDDASFALEANSLIIKNNKSLVKIVALAVLGTDYSVKKFNKLTKIFSDALTSQQLIEIVSQIFALSDHGNFINSTRLMIARNVIKPNEVE